MKFVLIQLLFTLLINHICYAQNQGCPTYLQQVGGITNGTFKADNTINSNGIILQNNTVQFTAGESIKLNAGFSTKANTNFTANVQNCREATGAATNSLAFNNSIQSVAEGESYSVEVNYQLIASGLLHLVLADENWNKIGEIWTGNLPAGSYTENLNFTVTGSPSLTTNYLQVRLLNTNWEDIGVELIEEILPGVSGTGISNSINLLNIPTSLNSGSTYAIDIEYSLQQSGLIYLLLMNESWEKIGEVWQTNLNTGNNTTTLNIEVDGIPSAGNNYIQAQLLDNNWATIGVPHIQETIEGNNTNPNALSWVNTPTSVSTGSNYLVEVSYTLNESGLIYLVLMDNNWNKIGEDWINLNQGSGIASLMLEVTGNHSASNNYLQANLFDENWQAVNVNMISETILGDVAGVNSLAWNSVDDLPNTINTGVTYAIDLQYNLNVAGLIYLQMMDANYNKIGESWTNILNPGPGEAQLNLLIEGNPSIGNNYLQAQLFNDSWGGLGVNAIQQTINNSQNNGATEFGGISSNDPPLTEYHSVFPLNCNGINNYGTSENGNPNPQNKQLTDTEGFYVIDINDCDGPNNNTNICPFGYATNWYVGCAWEGPIKAYWGPLVEVDNNNFSGTNFWMEWENQQQPNSDGYTAHAETDLRAQKHQWVWSSGEHGYPKQISALPNEVLCTANGQWALGSAGRAHVNLTIWVAESANAINQANSPRCDIIVHIWDNSGDMSLNNNFDLIDTIESGGITYDVIQRPGDEGEKASFNIVPHINGEAMTDRNPILGDYPAAATVATDYTIDVKDIIVWLRDNAVDENDDAIFDNSWWLAGIDWTITAQSAKVYNNGDNIPASKGRWTFNQYYIPDLN